MIRTQVRPEVETHLPPARSSQHRVRRQHRQPSPRAGPVGHHALGAAQEGIQGYQDKNRRGIVCPLPLCGCTVRTPPSHAAITCGTDGTGLQLPANRAAHTALMKTHLCSHRFTQGPLARGLDHPRWVYTLPNGDVLVAESNKPPPAEGAKNVHSDGLRGLAMGLVMKRAGAGTPSANRITLLRDTDGDGVADVRTAFMQDLLSPFGMALMGTQLFIATADGVVKVPYEAGQTSITVAPVRVTDLPAGANHHWTKNIIASPDGRRLYATVGSNSNAGDNGMAAEEGRAAIWEVDVETGSKRLFATGLRNPNGLGWEPQSKVLWTVVNERDELGNELVPDYLTSVKDGAFYGWPWSYWGQHVDTRVNPPNPDMVAKAIAPDFGLGSHVAPLGLAFSDARMPGAYASGAFIGQHGSWNRKELTGYNVVFVPFADGRPSGPPQAFLTGFLSKDGDAYGRPVGVALDGKGALLVADDVGNVVWRVVRSECRLRRCSALRCGGSHDRHGATADYPAACGAWPLCPPRDASQKPRSEIPQPGIGTHVFCSHPQQRGRGCLHGPHAIGEPVRAVGRAGWRGGHRPGQLRAGSADRGAGLWLLRHLWCAGCADSGGRHPRHHARRPGPGCHRAPAFGQPGRSAARPARAAVWQCGRGRGAPQRRAAHAPQRQAAGPARQPHAHHGPGQPVRPAPGARPIGPHARAVRWRPAPGQRPGHHLQHPQVGGPEPAGPGAGAPAQRHRQRAAARLWRWAAAHAVPVFQRRGGQQRRRGGGPGPQLPGRGRHLDAGRASALGPAPDLDGGGRGESPVRTPPGVREQRWHQRRAAARRARRCHQHRCVCPGRRLALAPLARHRRAARQPGAREGA